MVVKRKNHPGLNGFHHFFNGSEKCYGDETVLFIFF